MNREETIQEYTKRVIKPHLNEIEILSKQMRDIILDFGEQLEVALDVENEVEEISNHEIIQYHINKILELIG